MLYLHIPYCHHKCTYCAFYSTAGKHDTRAYVDALCKEVALRAPKNEILAPKTIYFGGGTPTLLPLAQIEQIVSTLRRHFNLSELQEATIEANPENLTEEYLEGLQTLHFFNRLSIGVQSFNNTELRLLNRVHTSQQAIEAIERSKAHGFSNISIDLIYSLPEQTLEDWKQNLQQIESLGVQHLSCYNLTVEPGTMLDRQINIGRLVPTDELLVVQQYHWLLSWAAQAGFEQYEISNFCRPGYFSRHNSRYWNRTPYIGFGAAAHSFDGTHRRWNIADTNAYIQGIATYGDTGETPASLYGEETLTQADAFNEYLMTALRTVEGIDKKLINQWFESMADTLTQRVKRFVAAGLLIETTTAYKPTANGLLHADGMASELFI